MSLELLTPAEMAELDRLAISSGPLDGYALMRNAGAAVARLALARFPQVAHIDVLCGPGNNGGDGYVAARLLRESGLSVSIWADQAPRPGSDAERALADCGIVPKALAEYLPRPGSLVVDGLYGAGLSKPLGGAARRAVEQVTEAELPLLAIDLPSGVSGDSGAVLGAAFKAAITITFVRKKPGHLLFPGRTLCGEVVVEDIGIRDDIVASVAPRCFENRAGLWRLPKPEINTHKYSRGHVGVFSGGPSSTGAARLSANGAARAGAGAVTLLSPANALAVNAAHLTSIILRRSDTLEDALGFLRDRRPQALVYGPGLGAQEAVATFALEMLAALGGTVKTLVLDADALSQMARHASALFAAARAPGAPALTLTPHDGEFARLFPDLTADKVPSKVERARQAADRSGCTIVLKGADTVIAAPDGRAAINTNGTSWLATAGSGDVLSGVIASLAAQGMPPFEAACAGVWVHAEAAAGYGAGLIAEDLPLALVPVLRRMHCEQ